MLRFYMSTGMDQEEVKKTPLTLYAPISFDSSAVPFVRGFLNYEQRLNLDGTTEDKYSISDTTASQWRNADSAVDLAQEYGTDTLASVQIDIRMLSFQRFSEVDPVDVVGAIGEISGFWLVVPLLFALLFYRNEPTEQVAEMRKFKRWRCRERDDGRESF